MKSLRRMMAEEMQKEAHEVLRGTMQPSSDAGQAAIARVLYGENPVVSRPAEAPPAYHRPTHQELLQLGTSMRESVEPLANLHMVAPATPKREAQAPACYYWMAGQWHRSPADPQLILRESHAQGLPAVIAEEAPSAPPSASDWQALGRPAPVDLGGSQGHLQAAGRCIPDYANQPVAFR